MGGSSTSKLRFTSGVLALALFGGPIAAVLTHSTPAAAQPGAAQRSEEAKQRYMKGVELHDEGDYQSALIEFRRSYDLVPNFNVLFNVGQEYFNLADYANALKTFQQYMEEGGKRIPPNRKEQVEGYIEKLKSRVATMSVKVNVQGAELKVDDQVISTVIPGNVLVSTGKRRIEVSKQGFRTQTKTEEFAGQETKEVVFELQPEAILSQGDGSKPPVVIIGDQKMQPKEPGPPIAPIVMWSITGALGIGAGVFGGLALSNQGSLDELKREEGHSEEELNDAASKARNMAIATDVFLGATVIAAGLSVYFTVDAVLTSNKKDDKPGAPPAPAAKVSVGPGYVGLTSSF